MIGRYNAPEPSNCGSGLRQLYVPFFDDDGHLDIKESGIFDMQDQIDSNADYCDIQSLVSRFSAGDLTALNRRQGFFGDFTSCPESYRQAVDIINGFNSVFSNLTPEQRNGATSAFEFLDKIKSTDSTVATEATEAIEASESEV